MKRAWLKYVSAGLLLIGISALAIFALLGPPKMVTAYLSGDLQEKKGNVLDYTITVPASESEIKVLEMMNGMSHQKVEAREKWGNIEMTPESIDEVYSVVISSDFPSKPALLDILDRWKKGDFSQADHEHNYIWELQGGSIGRATGLLTPEQEQEFVEKNFKK